MLDIETNTGRNLHVMTGAREIVPALFIAHAQCRFTETVHISLAGTLRKGRECKVFYLAFFFSFSLFILNRIAYKKL